MTSFRCLPVVCSKSWLRTIALLAVAVGLAMPSHVFAQEKKILFLAGPRDHGAPGRHEYERDVKTLAQSFDQATNLKGVKTQVIVGKIPRDLAELQDVAVIVIDSSSDRAEDETHPIFPPDPKTNHHGYDPETTAYLKSLNELIKKNKIGIVLIHYAVWAENWAARENYMNWTGGLWVQIASKNPVDPAWTMTPEPEAKTHPIWNGVKPWTYRDEVFCRFLLPTDKRRTNLVLATPQQDRFGVGPQIASWAYQRDDGGRGFVYGGADWRDNLARDDYRRFLMNGIVWAANIDVPAEGILSPTPDVSDVTPPRYPRGASNRPGGPGAPANVPPASTTAPSAMPAPTKSN